MRNVKRMMALLLCVILILAIPVLSYATSSSLITAESIKAKQDQIEKAKLDKGNLQKTLTDIKKLKEELESKKKNLKKYVNDLDANLKEIQDKIDELEAMIIKKEADIEETERQLEAAFEKKEDQYHSMKVRIQMMYERNDTYVLDILLGGGSFADMLDRMDQMEQVVAYDKEKLAEYELTHQFIEACKMELDEEKALLEEVRAGVELEKETLKELIAEKTTNYKI